MDILFYDVATPKSYSDQTLQDGVLGGTEATIVRVAHGLKLHHKIYVAQHTRSRDENEICDGVYYVSLENANRLAPDIVVLLRKHQWLKKVAELFPKAKLYFWLHNIPSKKLFSEHFLLFKYRYEIIAVSNFHRELIRRRLSSKWYQKLWTIFQPKVFIPIHTIYNPIANDLVPNQDIVNPSQLIFFSTPYKGLKYILKIFESLLQHFPDYELLVAAHSGWDPSITLPKQVKYLGPLAHEELMRYVRSSFCVFYPQTTHKETFGLVYAESNAVGTPVLAHDIGAAREILSDTNQLVDGDELSSIIDKLRAWQKSRPVIKGKSEFRLDSVLQSWLSLFDFSL